MGVALPVKFFRQAPHILLVGQLAVISISLARVEVLDWGLLDWRVRMALFMLWICGANALPCSLNMGSNTHSVNQTVAMEESGILQFPWI